MLKKRVTVMITLLVLALSSTAYPQQEVSPLPEAAVQGGSGVATEASPAKEDNRLPIQKQDEWQFIVSPYLWIPGINITTTTFRGAQGANVAWWDLVPDLFSKVFGIMGRAEAWKGRWGAYLDGYFAYVGVSGSRVGASRERSFGPVDFTVNKQLSLGGLTLSVPIPGQVGPGNITLTPSGSAKYITRIGNLDLGGRFLVGVWPLDAEKPLPALSMELLGGPRFNSVNQYVRINLSSILIANVPIDLSRFTLTGRHQSIKGGSLVIDTNLQYFEPFLGLRFGLWLTPKFLINLKGDVGGFGLVADDHVDCNLEALLGYRVHKNIYAYAGYRAHGTWYNVGKDLAQINLSGWGHGPVLGMAYAF